MELLIPRNTEDWEKSWEIVQWGITRVKNIIKGLPEPPINSTDYMMIYTTIYSMSNSIDDDRNACRRLYDGYRNSLEEFITSTILPSLSDKRDESILRELAKMWSDYKLLVKWLSRFFQHLDWFFVRRNLVPPLNMVGLSCFHDLVYKEIKINVRDAAISLIDREREGEQIDRTLLKNVMDIFVRINGYENDFEVAFLKDTAAYYSRKASSWIVSDLGKDYMVKAEQCLMLEKDRVAQYLHASSEPKLIAVVWDELHCVYINQLIEEKLSALLQDDKVDDPHPIP